jgi:hypothetical protein
VLKLLQPLRNNGVLLHVRVNVQLVGPYFPGLVLLVNRKTYTFLPCLHNRKLHHHANRPPQTTAIPIKISLREYARAVELNAQPGRPAEGITDLNAHPFHIADISPLVARAKARHHKSERDSGTPAISLVVQSSSRLFSRLW